MSTSLAATLKLVLSHVFQNALDLSSPLDDMRLDLSESLTAGTGAGQADQVWHDERTLVGAAESLDLAGVLTNVFGSTVTFAKLRGILIANTTTTAAANLTVGGAAANAFSSLFGSATDKLVITPGGLALLWAPREGYTVTAGTGDILKLDAGAATITYRIYLIGTTA